MFRVTDFSLLPIWIKLLISGLLFLSTLLEGALTLYEIKRKRKKIRCVSDIFIFIVSFVVLSYVTAYSTDPERVVKISFPFVSVIVLILLLTVYSVAGFIRNYRISRNEISPLSIRQALDKLNSGVCFSDSVGHIVLINRTLGELVYSLKGSYPRTLDEIESALKSVEKTAMADGENNQELYAFENGEIRRIYNIALTDASLRGFTQTVAQDVTELFNANKSLEEENERMSVTNEKISEMLERLSDRIRQQETLALKMRVHNDIGSSLIKISRIISGGADEDMETQLRLLQSAVGYFSTDRSYGSKTLDEIVSSAGEMNVEVVFDGLVPENESIRRLIALACRECVTNCVKHASGDRVNVKIKPQGEYIFVSFTNNGVQPDGPIAEGGGLSSLRNRIENAGGKMKVLHSPAFELQLLLKKEEDGDV